MNGNTSAFGIGGFAKKLRRAVPAVMAVIAAAVFSACGASVSTKLEADSGFKGSRTVTVVLSNDDLNSEIIGGAEAIEMVVKKYIPAECTYTSSADDSALTITLRSPLTVSTITEARWRLFSRLAPIIPLFLR